MPPLLRGPCALPSRVTCLPARCIETSQAARVCVFGGGGGSLPTNCLFFQVDKERLVLLRGVPAQPSNGPALPPITLLQVDKERLVVPSPKLPAFQAPSFSFEAPKFDFKPPPALEVREISKLQGWARFRG